jgi:hypothetical protein
MAILALAEEIDRLFSQPDATPASLSDSLQNLLKEYPFAFSSSNIYNSCSSLRVVHIASLHNHLHFYLLC